MTAELPDDLHPLEEHLIAELNSLTSTKNESTGDLPLSPETAADLLEAQIGSRLTDHTARWMRAEHGLGYYTIGSAGHESNAAVSLALRPTDPALLHYRAGGFYFGRATQIAGCDPTGDVLRGMLARSTDPIAGGRHKVFGSHRMAVIPQTSTIASHLPRAVGLAVSLGWGRSPGLEQGWPADSVVVCSFGDASLNHSTAQGALNWAANAAYRGQRVPILFLCEDNGIGISVSTPPRWVESSTNTRPALNWATADGTRPGEVHATAGELVAECRATGRPAFLRLHTVRYLGHAGTDVESAYRSPEELRADLDRDPIIGAARAAVDAGVCGPEEIVDWYLDERDAVRARALDVARNEPEQESAKQIMAPLATRTTEAIERGRVRIGVGAGSDPTTDPHDAPAAGFTLAQSINHALGRVLADRPQTLVFGEDVGRKGGVYGVTRGLQARYGEDRVFDTILDEQTILGLALGAALDGYIPLPEIQYLAYLHNAEDQLRGEAASLGFFSEGRYHNPMIVRIAAYAYQRGFGGHFHNDNSVAVLRDIPGVVIASPAHPADAPGMLSTCVAAAEVDGTVCAFLEPIARYHTTDLHEEGDGLWTARPLEDHIPIGTARVYPASDERAVDGGSDGTILTWGNGVFLSRRAQRRLATDHGESWRVVDLRWLAPLPVEDMIEHARATDRVVIVDETRHSGGVGEAIISALVESGFRGALRRVAAKDSFVPLGAAANLVLVNEDQIIDAALGL